MSVLRAAWRWIVAFGALLIGRSGGRRPARVRTIPPPPESPAGTRAVIALLLLAALAFAGFGAGYLLDLGNTFLGCSLALGFGFAAAAAITAGKLIVPQEEIEEELGSHEHVDARAEVTAMVREGGEGMTRRGVIVAAGCAGCAAAAALALPAASLGPLLDENILRRSPWRSGRRLVDSKGEPIAADEIVVGTFLSAFPEGADPERLDSPVIVARVRPEELRLPPERSGWAPEGLLAYSKICTHAACAISLFDYPTFPPTQPAPRLVCPCHYSVFDAVGGGDVLAGPAGRPLPQLPLRIDAAGLLVAAGGYSGPPGPSWDGVRQS